MRDLVIAATLLGAVLVAVAVGDRPPAPRPADAPPGEFSSARAQDFLRRFLGDGAPRPVGSEPNVRAALRIVAELRALGYAPEVQDTFDCGLYGMCARVRNVVAKLDGAAGGRAVLLVAHHDSVAAGPGAADDGAGVAALLEVARALRSGPPLPRPVVFLVDDGEEGGLVGANAFANRHPWARDVGAVVNLEARGTSGPSLMFETSGPSAWLARLLRELPRPRASSLFATVYAELPNDTDLTVFERRGVPGMNFAFIQGAERYHTAGDDLAHLSGASLQHQGEDALAAIRALARSDLEHPPPGDAVFFDVLGLGVVTWPIRAALPLALIGLLVTGALWVWRRDGLTLGAVAWGAAAFLFTPLVAAGLGLALRTLAVGVRLEAGLYAAQPWTFVAATWAAALAGALSVAWFTSGRTTAAGSWVGAALGWGTLAVITSSALPAASHLFAVPALTAAAAGLAWALSTRRARRASAFASEMTRPAQEATTTPVPPTATVIATPTPRLPWLLVVIAPATAAALIGFPVAWLLPSAAGSLAAPASAALVALVAGSLSPLLVQRPKRARRLLALLAVASFMATAAAASAAFRHRLSDEQRITVNFHEEAGTARWLVETDGSLPQSLRQLGTFERSRGPPLPGDAGAWFTAPAAPLGLPPPALTVLERRRLTGRLERIRAHLASARGTRVVLVAIPPSAQVASFTVEGAQAVEARRRFQRFLGGWQIFGCLTTHPEGVEVQLEWTADGPVEVLLLDRSPGLPRALAAPGWDVRPPGAFAAGDATVTSARVRL